MNRPRLGQPAVEAPERGMAEPEVGRVGKAARAVRRGGGPPSRCRTPIATLLFLALTSASATGAQIVAPAGRTLFNEEVLVRSLLRLETFEAVAGGEPLQELQDSALPPGSRIRVVGPLHPSPGERPPGVDVDEWEELEQSEAE